jgi:hypothetical protein
MITNSNFWLWFGGLWLAVGLCFLGIGGGVAVYRSGLAARLDAEGVPVEGFVVAKEIVAPRDRSTSYNVTFRFTDARGETIRGSAKLDAETWDALVERGPIEVVYLPDRPQTYRIAGQSDSELVIAIVFPLVGVVLALGGGLLLGNALRTRRVASTGAIANASVVEVRPGRLHVNGIPQWEVRYRFQDATGQAREGKCSVSPDAAQRLKPGVVGRVRYDARNPRANVWTDQSA